MTIILRMNAPVLFLAGFITTHALALTLTAGAQTGFGGRWGPQPLSGVVSRFDDDGDGILNELERQAARRYAVEARAGQNRVVSPNRRIPIISTQEDDLRRSRASSPGAGIGLYDDRTLRTLYLRFRSPDWFGELADFYNTDVEVPADLVVDGELYSGIGVRFRGNSSYWTTGDSLKKSFNLSINYGHKDQRLEGYRTLNLLNSHADPSFLREVLFSRISRQYIPAPKANLVKLVINGEPWGVYLNVQQINRDFLEEWFGSGKGVRWKVPPARGGAGGLAYKGPDPAAYQGSFELDGKDSPEAWEELIELSRALSTTHDSKLESELSPILNIDAALWFLALENVFIDSDGYFSRGADYLLYQDPSGRFHLITHDNNETFRYAGGGGPNRWPSSDPMLSPLGHADNPALPVISRLLALPHLRARYLAHIRTIVEHWLDWKVLGPMVQEYQALIAQEVAADDKKLYSLEAFAGAAGEDYAGRGGSSSFSPWGTPGFKEFVTERRTFLLSHPQLDRRVPEIRAVEHPPNPPAGQPIRITARVRSPGKLDEVLLYYAMGRDAHFARVAMFDDGNHGDARARDGLYAGDIPPVHPGLRVRYYVEARALSSLGTSVFYPRSTERGAREFRVTVARLENPPVVINELMARNSRGLRDPQGQYDDWIELYNPGSVLVDLSGMYLSDDPDKPRKWTIPFGTTIAPLGHLVIWADGDDGEDGGDGGAVGNTGEDPVLHANFRLSGKGETLLLVDTDESANRILDLVEFGEQQRDVSFGRLPDGDGEFRALYSSPGSRNGK
jgi:hypothetical protein